MCRCSWRGTWSTICSLRSAHGLGVTISPDTKHIGAFGGITAAIGHMYVCDRYFSIPMHVLIGVCRVDESMKAASLLSDTLLDPKTAKSYDASKTAMARAFNYNTNAWDWYESPGNEFRLSRFGSCMDGHKNFAPPDAVAFGVSSFCN